MKGGFFDPKAELHIDEHYRPHWSQSGAIVFVTFRTHDSIPQDVLQRWHHEKVDWLRRKGVQFKGDWAAAIAELNANNGIEFHRHFDRLREACLDDCHGQCLLRNRTLAKMIADSLLHFDGERYHMGDFVVMPNHVHLLASFLNAEQMRKQFASWLRWTATKINRSTGEKGHFWQEEPFDHLVRSSEQLEYLQQYIKDNPKKANLKRGEYLLRLESEEGVLPNS